MNIILEHSSKFIQKFKNIHELSCHNKWPLLFMNFINLMNWANSWTFMVYCSWTKFMNSCSRMFMNNLWTKFMNFHEFAQFIMFMKFMKKAAICCGEELYSWKLWFPCSESPVKKSVEFKWKFRKMANSINNVFILLSKTAITLEIHFDVSFYNLLT